MDQDIPHKATIPEHWLHWTFLLPDLLITPLFTIDKQPVKIISSGQLNFDNGPDIHDATLQIDGVLQKGDIEFHVNQQDWFKHGHQEDRRYQNIILHVLWDLSDEIDSRLQRRFPHLILQNQLQIPYSDWVEKMAALEAEEVSKLPDISDRITPALLKHLGQKRFYRKVQRFKSWFEQFSPEDAFIISLAETLGYAKNKFPFRQLLWESPPSKILQTLPKCYHSPIGIWVYLALRADLLTPYSFTRSAMQLSPVLETVNSLHQYFSRTGTLPVLRLNDWYFSRVRPANNPIIRLASLAQIIFQNGQSSLFRRILQSAIQRTTLKKLLILWQRDLRLPLNVRLSEAIGAVYNLKNSPQHTIGTIRMRQFIINSVFPMLFLWAERKENYGFQEYIISLYEEFPACEDIRQPTSIGAGTSCKQLFTKLAIYQQGLLELLSQRPGADRFLLQHANQVKERKLEINTNYDQRGVNLIKKHSLKTFKEPDISFCI